MSYSVEHEVGRSAPYTVSTQHAFHPPWPGITGPWCDYCSWAYRGRWPSGRMEVKYANAMCPKRAHTHHLVT